MESNNTLSLLYFSLGIVGAIVCYRQAKWLNRNAVEWGIIGFIFPIVAMILIFCLQRKPVKNVAINTSIKPFTKYYTENGVIEVENYGERKVLINGNPASSGRYELNRFETIEVIDGKIKS